MRKKRRKVIQMKRAVEIKPIRTTPPVSGEIAKQVIKEAMTKPSVQAIDRNEKASRRVASLRA